MKTRSKSPEGDVAIGRFRSPYGRELAGVTRSRGFGTRDPHPAAPAPRLAYPAGPILLLSVSRVPTQWVISVVNSRVDDPARR